MPERWSDCPLVSENLLEDSLNEAREPRTCTAESCIRSQVFFLWFWNPVHRFGCFGGRFARVKDSKANSCDVWIGASCNRGKFCYRNLDRIASNAVGTCVRRKGRGRVDVGKEGHHLGQDEDKSLFCLLRKVVRSML